MPENNYGQVFGQSAMQGLGNLAGSLPSALIGGAFGLASTALNNKYAKEREKLARKENFEYGEKSADAADARTRKLFSDLYSPAAQMSLIKEAGLSPSIFAGGSLAGVSGQSGAQGSGAAGISPNIFGMPNIDLAQYELAHAQARKANAEADEIQGLNTLGQEKINNLIADSKMKAANAGYQEAATSLTNTETQLKEIEVNFNNETFWANVQEVNERVNKLTADAQKAQAEARKAAKDADFSEQMFEEQCEMLREQVRLLTEQITTEKSVQKLNAKQAKYLGQMTQKAAYDMQMEYWHALLEGKEFDFKVNQEKWERAFKRWAKEADMSMTAQALEIEQWATKWNVVGHILGAGLQAATFGALSKSTNTNPPKKK